MPAQKDIVVLLDALQNGFNNALPDPKTNARGPWQPKILQGGYVLETYCNLFTSSIAAAFGYDRFTGLNANQMHALISNPANGWIKIDGAIAQSHANAGSLVIASMNNPDGHGHVCVIAPGKMEFSGSFNKPVPKCVNVGKDVFFGRRISFAFRIEPDYFVLGDTV